MKTSQQRLSIFFILILFASFLTAFSPAEQTQLTAVNGVLDLTHPKQDHYPLNGEWLFYWNNLVMPDELKLVVPSAVVSVPDSWTNYNIDGETLPSKGSATYALKVLLPDDTLKKSWVLNLPIIYSSYQVWINNQLVVQNGLVDQNESNIVASRQNRSIHFQADSKELNIVIQVSNNVTQNAGIVQQIHIGEANAMMKDQLKDVSIQLFLSGALVIMSIYHFGLYAMRRKESSTLYFGLFCLTIGIRGLLTGETIIYYFLPELPFELTFRLEYVCLCISVLSFTRFLQRIYPEDIKPIVFNIYAIIPIIYGLMSLLTPKFTMTYTLPFFQYSILIGISYALYIFVIAVFRKREGAYISLFGAFALIITIFNDILFSMGYLNTGYSITFGLCLFIISQSFIMASSFSKAFSSSEELTSKLIALNTSLEEKVKERTKLLEESNQSLQQQMSLDGLTNIPNRRYFNSFALEKLSNKETFSLLFIDIDHFKNYNDTYGHLAGDDCLIKVAHVLQSVAETYNSIAVRYGGEEFAVIAPPSLNDAIKLADIMIASVRDLQIPHSSSEVSPYVTISCGVVNFSNISGYTNEDLVQLLEDADKALYAAKQQGKNRYVIYHT